MDDARFAEMISKIAHELRSPLTSVKGFSATLVKRWDRFNDQQRLQFVETIHADAERMGRIVSEVLDLARLEAGRLELHITEVDLKAAVEEMLARMTELPGADRVATEVEEGLIVRADGERLQHMIGNLVENAIKFSDEGPITIDAAHGNGWSEIFVRDEGVGIAPERIDTVFSGPAPGGQRSGPSGSGLGLYLTRRLAEAHGGRVEVTSKVQQGSTFTIVLPRREPES